MPADINWHFIGHIQTNKVKKLLSVHSAKPISLLIETVDSQKLAEKLNKELDKILSLPPDFRQPVLV